MGFLAHLLQPKGKRMGDGTIYCQKTAYDKPVRKSREYFRFHLLLHFGASRLMKEGVDPKTIQGILRHSNFKTTEIYLHLIKGSDQEAMNKLDFALNGVKNVLKFEKRKTKRKRVYGFKPKPLSLVARLERFEPPTP